MSDLAPIARLEELEKHLDALIEAPETPLNRKLFDDVELQLNPNNSIPLIPRLLPKLTSILLRTAQDPSVIVSLSIKLIKPLSFRDILSFADESSLVLGLQSDSPAPNHLALSVISKATTNASDIAILSAMKALMTQLITTWLSTPDVGVSDKISQVLIDGLTIDCENPLPILNEVSGEHETHEPGQGLLWRRIFFDQDILETIYRCCDRDSHHLDLRQQTLAQSRLSAIMPRLSQINFSLVTKSTLPEVESRFYNAPSSTGGLLYFATNRMSDPNGGDELLRIMHYQFWYELFDALNKVKYTEDMAKGMRTLVRVSSEMDENLTPFLHGILQEREQSRMDDMEVLLGKMGLGIGGGEGDSEMAEG